MNVAIISHRRSGTHLTIDSMLNNFSEFKCNSGSYFTLRLEEVEKDLEDLSKLSNCIVKTHILPKFKSYGLNEKQQGDLRNFFRTIPKLYIYRNGLDVMVSMYFYMKNFNEQVRHQSFSQFLRTPLNGLEPIENLTPPKLWALHIESWFASDLLKDNTIFLKYEDWFDDFDATLRKVADFLSLAIPQKIVDVRVKNKIAKGRIAFLYGELKKKLKQLAGVEVTAVLPRRGVPGDHVNYFSAEDYAYFEQIAGSTMHRLHYKIPGYDK